jgi:hypothetical protein
MLLLVRNQYLHQGEKAPKHRFITSYSEARQLWSR